MRNIHDRPGGAVAGTALPVGVRDLPSVQRLLETPEAVRLLATTSRPAVVAALRDVLGSLRAERLQGDATALSATDIMDRAGARLAADRRPALRRVLNATGIALHTNLGRAPLAPEALEAVAEAARGYVDLEFDLETGTRGGRAPGVESWLKELTGAAAGLAVNNCAAAVLLALSALAAGGEVIVSRGELVEIGGGFRIPEVIRQGGARLVEVGTTNKTRLADYRDAITPATRVLLKVHPSNYRMVGFTAEAALPELVGLARACSLLVVHDLGSGDLGSGDRGSGDRGSGDRGSGDRGGGDRGSGPMHRRRPATRAGPTPGESVAAGVDVVAFSGDKLLGGPQAGILVGTAASLATIRRHPLLRALRLDKMSLAALEATLRLHRDPALAAARIPVLAMLAQDEATLQARAERLLARLAPPVQATIIPTAAYAGGGTLPGAEIPSRAVTLAVPGLAPEALARRLRRHRPAVVGRVADQRVLLDLFALSDGDLGEAAAAVMDAAAVP